MVVSGGVGEIRAIFFFYYSLFLSFTWVINPRLNDIIQSKSTGGLLAPQPLVHGRSEDFGHMVVVLAEVRILLIRRVIHLHLVVRVPERHGGSLGGGWRGQTVTSSGPHLSHTHRVNTHCADI